ncbi:MAG: LPP20 family lipoprotein [bacterium]
MKISKNLICIWLSILILIPLFLFGQGYVQQVGSAGKVNWTNQVIKCTGIGAPNPNQSMAAQRAGALRAAKLDALRNLLETVRGININSETTVENAMVTSDVIQSNVQGAIRGYRVVDTRYMSSGDVEVDVEVPITGVIMDNLLQQQFGGGTLLTGEQLLCPTCGQPWPSGKEVPPGVDLIHVGGDYQADYGGGVYTGLIIDARGLNLRPAMAPKVLDPKGEEVYGSRYVEREYAVDIGMVGYEKSVDRASHNERVADNPLIVKGAEAVGQNKTDVVVSDADAVKIHNAAANMNFLERCKVMFILD